MVASQPPGRYGYAVQDDEGNDFNQQEQSDGNTVRPLSDQVTSNLRRSPASTRSCFLTGGSRLSPTAWPRSLASWWGGGVVLYNGRPGVLVSWCPGFSVFPSLGFLVSWCFGVFISWSPWNQILAPYLGVVGFLIDWFAGNKNFTYSCYTG